MRGFRSQWERLHTVLGPCPACIDPLSTSPPFRYGNALVYWCGQDGKGGACPGPFPLAVPRLRATVAFRVQSIPLAHGNRRCTGRSGRLFDWNGRCPWWSKVGRKHGMNPSAPIRYMRNLPEHRTMRPEHCMCMPRPPVLRRRGV